MFPKIALVHDWLTSFGGSERVLLALSALYPDAPIFTLVASTPMLPAFAGKDIRTSFIQKLPFAQKHFRKYISLMPTAIEQFDLSEYDLVISSSHAVAKGVLTKPSTKHLCYCHTPMRYAWSLYFDYLAKPQFGGKIAKMIMPWSMHALRIWDVASAGRVDRFLANSQNVQQRIAKYYRRESTVVYPPIPVKATKPQGVPREDFFLIVSRLIPQKRVDLVVEACTKANKNLVVIGEGSELQTLQTIAGPTVQFLGFLPDNEVASYYERCSAFIFPAEDDFGMTPVEAMAYGTPVIAYGKGGALETVIDNKTGILFHEPSISALLEAFSEFDHNVFSAETIRNHALQFDEAMFKEAITKNVQTLLT